mmetsp:Transcript_31930/g.51563  ORF Transcript_31930/g.51563 Transcript_31930/m.51563 type:complete len:214 (+) Transcript_31930:176-817(+)|eukprot:CAMPEP_0184663912 /NCGR_PEP_ID=MMETSP0308-20130426/50452_1 /TAXON_ID=38269 /ORGANISM="Gloeochaete witrockiana, Strain SAG 46.84" /LENGTH=213 /DNA_ID=CAMNT_0027106981 /DNA_START=84 /DNA_END=725 /DNA_ORIENTATION=+
MPADADSTLWLAKENAVEFEIQETNAKRVKSWTGAAYLSESHLVFPSDSGEVPVGRPNSIALADIREERVTRLPCGEFALRFHAFIPREEFFEPAAYLSRVNVIFPAENHDLLKVLVTRLEEIKTTVRVCSLTASAPPPLQLGPSVSESGRLLSTPRQPIPGSPLVEVRITDSAEKVLPTIGELATGSPKEKTGHRVKRWAVSLGLNSLRLFV